MNQQLDPQFIADFSLEGLNEDQQAEMAAQILDSFQLRMNRVIGEKLTEEQVQEFEALDPDSDEDAVLNWLRKSLPDYDAIVAQEYEAFKQDFAEASQSA